MKKNAIIVTSIVVLLVKSINKILDKTIIVKTTINRSTTFMLFNIIRLSNTIHIKIKTLIIIIKNISIATQINNQTISEIGSNRDSLSRLHYNCLIRVNFFKSRSKTRQIRKISSVNKSQTLKKIISHVVTNSKFT